LRYTIQSRRATVAKAEQLALPDDWQVETGWYDADRFYFRFETGARTTQVGARVSLGLQRGLNEMLQEALSTAAFPYKTGSDFVKDAIIHRLYYLRNQFTSNTRRMAMEQALSREVGLEKMLQHHAAQLQYEQTIDQVFVPTMESYLKRGDAGRRKAIEVLHETLEHIDNFTDEFWQEQYRAKVLEKYGNLLA